MKENHFIIPVTELVASILNPALAEACLMPLSLELLVNVISLPIAISPSTAKIRLPSLFIVLLFEVTSVLQKLTAVFLLTTGADICIAE
jgi:hypothetical protein